MKTVLMIAEKPSLAQSIAKFLSNGKMTTRKGINGACSVHEYKGDFFGEMVKFKMTAVCGHVMALDFHNKYNNWEAVNPVELFHAKTLKKEANPKLNMVKFLQHESKGIDIVVLWLDCDKEGENICFEVLDCVLPVMSRPTRSNQQTIFRAKFSAITESDIKYAMNNLVRPDENQARSVDARQELDLRIGCAFTRFQTRYFQGKYGNLDSSLISYGPCQTPTLGFCVQRHDMITSFKPEVFWLLQVKVEHSLGKQIMLDWNRARVFDKEVAIMYHSTISNVKESVVDSVIKKEKVKQRPQALHTVEMLRVGSSALGMGPQHTMQVAESLYTQGYISYPRTETTHYPEKFDLRGTLQQLQSGTWGSAVQDLLRVGLNKPRKGHDAGDHPPITPTRLAREGDLSGDAWRLYDYVVRHFVATLSTDCKYLQTKISFIIGKELFTFVGKTPSDPGFTSIMPWATIPAEETIPSLEKGDKCKVSELKVVERQTSPPDYLTESELITMMEKHGIGTDASIPVHINNITQRNYVQLQNGRRLVPTSLGIVLVHGYQKIDQELVLPTMRSSVEETLNLIAAGKADFGAVLSHTIHIFCQKYSFFEKCIANMDELFEVSFTKLADTGKALSRCGKCVRYMKLVNAKPMRLHCSHCDETYSLPQNGTIKLYKELKCPLDDFELVVSSTGSQGKSTPICPYCYNNPPFQGMKKGMGCPECLHPNCKFSPATLSVTPCFTCDDGLVVFDKMSAPKWKMACNKCNFVIHMFEDAFKVTLSDEGCDQCGASFFHVTFHKDRSPLSNMETEHTGCAFCDPTFVSMVKFDMAKGRHPKFRHYRGGKRGRGRGRGRKRRQEKTKDKMAQLDAFFL